MYLQADFLAALTRRFASAVFAYFLQLDDERSKPFVRAQVVRVTNYIERLSLWYVTNSHENSIDSVDFVLIRMKNEITFQYIFFVFGIIFFCSNMVPAQVNERMEVFFFDLALRFVRTRQSLERAIAGMNDVKEFIEKVTAKEEWVNRKNSAMSYISMVMQNSTRPPSADVRFIFSYFSTFFLKLGG